MSEFPQTWYRPKRWSDSGDVEQLRVLNATEHFITVDDPFWSKPRREKRGNATPSLRDCLESMLANAERNEQAAADAYSRAVQRRKNVRKQLDELS